MKSGSQKLDPIVTDNVPTSNGAQNIEIKHELVDEIRTESDFSDSQNFHASIDNEDYEFDDNIVVGPFCFDGEPVPTFTDDQDFEVKHELVDDEISAEFDRSDTHTHTSHMSTYENEYEQANEGKIYLNIIQILSINQHTKYVPKFCVTSRLDR